MPPQEPLGPFEFEVLRYVADHGPTTVGHVARHFAEKSGYARTTVLTVMERLRAKRYLRRRKDGRRYQYVVTISKADLFRSLIGDFVERVLGGSVSPFIAYLAQSESLEAEEVRKLNELAQRLERDENSVSRGEDGQ